jgi:single-stranded-DNA-specific exonuclease
MKQFAPFGPGNMSPIYVTEYVQDAGYSRLVGKEEDHLKLDLIDLQNNRQQGIAFFMADKFPLLQGNNPLKICYSVEENEFNGIISLQLRVRDIQKCE